MSEYLRRHIECDRCRREWTGQPTEQPAGWGAVQFIQPPLATFDGKRLMLCDECYAMALNIVERPTFSKAAS